MVHGMDRKPNQPGAYASMSRAWAIAFSFAASVMAGGLIGWVIDYFAKSSPVALLVGLGLGLVTGMVRFIREAKAAEREFAAGRARRQASKPPPPTI